MQIIKCGSEMKTSYPSVGGAIHSVWFRPSSSVIRAGAEIA